MRVKPEMGIVTLQAQPTMTIRTTTTMQGIQATLGDVLPAVWGYLQAKGVHPVGPPFVRYFGVEGQIDLEGGLPVASAVEGEGRIRASELPGGEALSALHIGSYDRMRETYQAMEAWMREHGVRSGGAPWEVYLTDPGEVQDPSQWKTQIVWPIAR
jgi:AraC family transcriptional regulator